MDDMFRSDAPLYLQIEQYLQFAILDGTFPSGGRLPSIRELSLRLEVTPNTLQRALQRLEAEGLIYTERTSGKFVTNDARRVAALRGELLRARVGALAADLRRHGYDKEEILTCFEREWNAHDRE